MKMSSLVCFYFSYTAGKALLLALHIFTQILLFFRHRQHLGGQAMSILTLNEQLMSILVHTAMKKIPATKEHETMKFEIRRALQKRCVQLLLSEHSARVPGEMQAGTADKQIISLPRPHPRPDKQPNLHVIRQFTCTKANEQRYYLPWDVTDLLPTSPALKDAALQISALVWSLLFPCQKTNSVSRKYIIKLLKHQRIVSINKYAEYWVIKKHLSQFTISNQDPPDLILKRGQMLTLSMKAEKIEIIHEVTRTHFTTLNCRGFGIATNQSSLTASSLVCWVAVCAISKCNRSFMQQGVLRLTLTSFNFISKVEAVEIMSWTSFLSVV